MTRSTSLKLIPPAYVAPAQPIGDPLGDTTPAIQRALNTLNNVAYKTRTVVWSWAGDDVSFTVPTSSTAVLWRWRSHIPEGIATLQVGVTWRLSVGGGSVIFSLRHNGTPIATLSPTASGAFETKTTTTGVAFSSGDCSFDILAGGGVAGTGTLTISNVWVCFAEQTVP